MGKTAYEVVAILPGRQKDYYDFWTRNVKVNLGGEELHPALLAITVTVTARNKAEAEATVRKTKAGHTIDSAATKRLD